MVRKASWKTFHLTLCSYTATATYFSLPVFKKANANNGIKIVYITLAIRWMMLHYQRQLGTGTTGMKLVKEGYNAIVNAISNIYKQTQKLEALGISKAMCKPSTVCAMYLLNYALRQVAMLSKCLQAEKIDLTAVVQKVC